MSLLSVNVAGKIFIVEAANKGTAKAWGREKLEVAVSDATADDVSNFMLEGGEIVKLAPAPKKEKADAAPAAE